MRSEDLQRLCVAERDEDLDSPLGVVRILLETDLAEPLHSCSGEISLDVTEKPRTGRTIESRGELLVDLVEIGRAHV
mgnify:FL=1